MSINWRINCGIVTNRILSNRKNRYISTRINLETSLIEKRYRIICIICYNISSVKIHRKCYLLCADTYICNIKSGIGKRNTKFRRVITSEDRGRE